MACHLHGLRRLVLEREDSYYTTNASRQVLLLPPLLQVPSVLDTNVPFVTITHPPTPPLTEAPTPANMSISPSALHRLS